jgi:hypothetical protein
MNKANVALTPMANPEDTDDVGLPRDSRQEKTPIKHSRESGHPGGERASDRDIHGSREQEFMGGGNHGGYSRYDWGAAAQGNRNGDRGGDYIPSHPHSIRAVKAMTLIDSILWWGIWVFRLAVAVTLAIIVLR